MSNLQTPVAKFDSMCTLPNGATYVTVGPLYYRYSNIAQTSPDAGYPLTIKSHFISAGLTGMEAFYEGFDSMCLFPNGKLYITKGGQYARFTWDGLHLTLEKGPLSIAERWPSLPLEFQSGIDTMSLLGNDKIYFTKGNQYVRYTHGPGVHDITMDPGYPQAISAASWGITAAYSDFLAGFDAVALASNGKTYVSKNGQYIRYSDIDAFVIDPGYPLTLQNGWGV
ncbi:MAG: hypothetical protein GQ574_02130 [Crocinitomix sp.]|nr:hypothetical protein [Crocinitomix sp.]